VSTRDTRLRLWYERGDSDVVERPFDELDIESESTTYAAELAHPLYRSENASFWMGLAGEIRRSRTFLFGEPFSFVEGPEDGLSKVSVLRFWQDWIYRDLQQVFALRSTTSLGIELFDATDRTNLVPDGQFVSWLLQLQWARRWPWWGIESVLRLDAQLATEPLLGLEQFSLGGFTTVRGYRESTLVRDQGAAASLELRLPLWRAADGRPIVQLCPFADYGVSFNRRRGPTPHPRTLASAGVGLRVSLWRRAYLHVYWGEELREVRDPSVRDLQDTGVHARLELDLF
jgi:hemolysin activation/secretion protein